MITVRPSVLPLYGSSPRYGNAYQANHANSVAWNNRFEPNERTRDARNKTAHRIAIQPTFIAQIISVYLCP